MQDTTQADLATKEDAAFNLMRRLMAGQMSAPCEWAPSGQTTTQLAIASLDIGTGPSTAELLGIVAAAARGADVSLQALVLLSRIAHQHAEFGAGV